MAVASWTTNLTKMGINEATALKLARKIRKQIMHNMTAIWHTRCEVTHDNKERDEILLKMREVAKDAQKAGVFSDANRNVQRACEIYKKLADKKKWIATTQKRIADAKRKKSNQQKHWFRQHFARKENIPKEPTAPDRVNTPELDSETETEEDKEKIHVARRSRQTTTKRIAKELDSSDSEEEPETKENPTREQQTATRITKTQTEQNNDKEEEPTRTRPNQTGKRQKTERTPKPSTQRNAQFALPPACPAGGAAAGGEGGEGARAISHKKHK